MATTSFQGGGYPGRRYGSFSGKDSSNPHNPGRITTLWAYGGTGHLYGSFTGKEPSVFVPPAATPPPTETPAGRRTRRRIILRIDGRLREVETLEQVLEVLKAVKKEVPAIARETAEQLVRTGKRLGEAQREESSAIEVVEAPSSVRDLIQGRIDEVQRLFWKRVQAYIKALDDDDEEVMALL